MGVINDKFVFAVGGGNSPSLFGSLEMLDVFSEELCWEPKNSTAISRQHLGVGALDNCIYAVSYANVKLISCYKYIMS